MFICVCAGFTVFTVFDIIFTRQADARSNTEGWRELVRMDTRRREEGDRSKEV